MLLYIADFLVAFLDSGSGVINIIYGKMKSDINKEKVKYFVEIYLCDSR